MDYIEKFAFEIKFIIYYRDSTDTEEEKKMKEVVTRLRKGRTIKLNMAFDFFGIMGT